jgi:hypothetical protein
MDMSELLGDDKGYGLVLERNLPLAFRSTEN